MSGRLRTLPRMTYDLFSNATSSPESAYGPSRLAERVCKTTRPYGADHALVSLSARQAKERGLLTSATSGPLSTISSSNAALRSSLASRLREQTETLGSTLYRLTWTQRIMPSGLLKPSLRASERRTKEHEITGWPTPTTRDYKDTGDLSKGINRKNGKSRLDCVPRVAFLTSWTTPQAHDTSGRSKTQKQIHGSKHGCACLTLDVEMASWPTPMAGSPGTENYNQAGNNDSSRKTVALCGVEIAGHNLDLPEKWSGPARLTASGQMLTGSDAGMKSGGQLSPAHSLWLMLGPFATAWAVAGERVERKSKRGSKKVVSTTASACSEGQETR
jgi:hypothetical protein